MRIEKVDGPDVEPITVEQARLNTRIDLDTDDDILERLIKGAREFVEKYINGALITQDWIVYFDIDDKVTCRGAILLPFMPVQEIDAITSYDRDNDGEEMEVTDYYLSGRRVCLNSGSLWPTDLRDYDCLAIEVVVGYGDDAESIPTPILEAMYKLIAHGYEHREAYFDSTDPVPLYANVPWSITSMLQPYRIFTF